MKRSGFYLLLIGGLFSLLLSPACSTTEEQAIVYDITGNWIFSCQWAGGPNESRTFGFVGSVINGVANDMTNGYSGVYTVNNTAVEIITDYLHPMCGTVSDIYTGVFTSPTSMAGSHNRTHTGTCMFVGHLTWTATKL